MTSITSTAQWSIKRNQMIFAVLCVIEPWALTVTKLVRFLSRVFFCINLTHSTWHSYIRWPSDTLSTDTVNWV